MSLKFVGRRFWFLEINEEKYLQTKSNRNKIRDLIQAKHIKKEEFLSLNRIQLVSWTGEFNLINLLDEDGLYLKKINYKFTLPQFLKDYMYKYKLFIKPTDTENRELFFPYN